MRRSMFLNIPDAMDESGSHGRADSGADKGRAQQPYDCSGGSGKKREYMEQFLGKRTGILTEEKISLDGATCWVGHTPRYLRAAVLDQGQHSNELLSVQAETIGPDYTLMGRETDGVLRNSIEFSVDLY